MSTKKDIDERNSAARKTIADGETIARLRATLAEFDSTIRTLIVQKERDAVTLAALARSFDRITKHHVGSIIG